MGADKALIEIGGGQLIDIALAALAGAVQRLVVGGDELGLQDALARAGAVYVPDRWPGEGPLGAVVTALGTAEYTTAVILPCDLPGITLEDVKMLLEALEGADEGAVPAAAIFADHRRHFLPLALNTGALSVAERLFASGRRSVASLLDEVSVMEVAAVASAVNDVDTPEDLRSPNQPNSSK